MPVLLTASCLLPTAFLGCGKPPKPSAAEQAELSSDASQQMSGFALTGYQEDGSKRWTLHGHGASVEDDIVTVLRPDAVGFDPQRTAFLTASAAQVRQRDRHVRLEHDVTIHTSDGMWLSAPVLHWVPDRDEMATETPVRIETDHMLLRGRGMSGVTRLKQATLFTDIEMVLNPSDHEALRAAPEPVVITCDGPLAFDYANHVATFEQNVHVKDPSGDLYSDKLVAYLNPQTRTIRYAEASGHVRIRQQVNRATSERAIYEPALGTMTLVGRPSLLVYPESNESPTVSFGGLAPSDASRPTGPASGPAPTAPN